MYPEVPNSLINPHSYTLFRIPMNTLYRWSLKWKMKIEWSTKLGTTLISWSNFGEIVVAFSNAEKQWLQKRQSRLIIYFFSFWNFCVTVSNFLCSSVASPSLTNSSSLAFVCESSQVSYHLYKLFFSCLRSICPEYDLCSNCEPDSEKIHRLDHEFMVINYSLDKDNAGCQADDAQPPSMSTIEFNSKEVNLTSATIGYVKHYCSAPPSNWLLSMIWLWVEL